MKSAGTKAGLAAAGLALALVVAEGVVRLFELAPAVGRIERGRFRLSANPRLGYEPTFLDYQGTEAPFHDYQGPSNRLGYRDVDHDVEKPAGTYRIVVLGDSIGAGLGVARYEDTFPSLLEHGLRAAGLAAEVINLSVSGYNTQQEVETLKERGLAFDPDLVLVAYCLNDRWRDDGTILGTLMQEELDGEELPVSRLEPLALHSALYRWLRYRTGVLRPRSPEELEHAYQVLARDSVEESLAELGELAQRHSLATLLVVFPALGELDPYPHAGEHRSVEAWARAADLEVLDLLPAFQRCAAAGRGALHLDVFHPSPQGHRCAAEALVPRVLGLAPR